MKLKAIALIALLTLLSAAFAAETSEVPSDYCQQAAQLADANNKYLRSMDEQGFLTVNGMGTLLAGYNNRSELAYANTQALCNGAADRIDGEFTWLKVDWLAEGVALLLAIYVVWTSMAKGCFGMIRPMQDPRMLLVNGAAMIRDDFHKAEMARLKDIEAKQALEADKLKQEIKELKRPKLMSSVGPVEPPKEKPKADVPLWQVVTVGGIVVVAAVILAVSGAV